MLRENGVDVSSYMEKMWVTRFLSTVLRARQWVVVLVTVAQHTNGYQTF